MVQPPVWIATSPLAARTLTFAAATAHCVLRKDSLGHFPRLDPVLSEKEDVVGPIRIVGWRHGVNYSCAGAEVGVLHAATTNRQRTKRIKPLRAHAFGGH